MSLNDTNVAVIGAGFWGQKHVDEYTEIGVNVTVADPSSASQKICKEKYGSTVVSDYKDVIKNDKIWGVSICTPNASHYSLAKEFLKAGKHVLVEKPLALNVAEAQELVDLSRDKQLVLGVGHIFRYNNSINKVKKMIEDDEIGEVRILKLRWTNMEPLFTDRDVIFDLAPHAFDIIDYLLAKNPDELSCVGNSYRRSSEPEAVFINGRVDKTIINIELSWLTPPKIREVVIVGSKKSLIVNATAQTIQVIELDGKKYDLELVPNNTIRDELESFLKNIKKPSEVTAADGNVGLRNIKIINVAQQALSDKRTLRLSWA